MASYDSDSSDDAAESTATNILLGFASTEPTGDDISQLGGYPTWLDEKTAPSGALAKCKVCNDFLTLLLQLNGDLPEHFAGHERRLYLFSCRRKTCRRKEGSVRGVRATRIAKGSRTKKPIILLAPESLPEEKQTQVNIGASLFGVESNTTSPLANPLFNPFSDSSNGKALTNPFSPSSSSTTNVTSEEQFLAKEEPNISLPATFASKARISSSKPSSLLSRPHEPWPAQSFFPSVYPKYYFEAEYETLDIPSVPEIPSNTKMDVDELDAGSHSGKEDKEIFESSIDKTLQKFADRTAQNAEQVLRYEFRGQPLLYSNTDAVGKSLSPHTGSSPSNVKVVTTYKATGIPCCPNCGSERVFELQLMPHAITELEADDMSLEGMEWGTILLGVCNNDCTPSDVPEGEVGYLEEWVGVQWDDSIETKLTKAKK